MAATCVSSVLGMMDMPASVVHEVVKKVNYEYLGDIPDGAGCSGTVVRAVATHSNEVVAIKVIPKKDHHLHRKEAVYQEVRTQRMVHHHPNVVTLRDFFEDDGNFYLVMDYCPGGDLFTYIANEHHMHGGITEIAAKKIFTQLVEVVQYMHNHGVVHGDLKLENILIDDQLNIRVCDFGMAFESARVHEQTGTLRGTPFYMSPTRLRVKEARFGSEQDDLWACGILLYKMLTCEIPFDCHEKSGDSFTTKCTKLMNAIHMEGPTFQHRLRSKGCLTEVEADFIGRLLCMDDKLRATPKECLAHSWLNPNRRIHDIKYTTCVPPVQNVVVMELPAPILLC